MSEISETNDLYRYSWSFSILSAEPFSITMLFKTHEAAASAMILNSRGEIP
ncbi:hypothetical protein [Paenibacillus sp. LHD-38]|uniref:hypothetical protein n=1 Tax=Paenibacillus sp. LHD-38 TaxID=3072143 RepID=UPI00280CF33A|nr:hypothetical protein [Paenibacillus sp. LHD-38]MDQ8739265.1 hypothetical protein [Paenibacillus sp. LHD-38]